MKLKNKFIILPAIDIRGGNCVRLIQGDYNRQTTYGEAPASQAQVWEKQGAKFLHLVDLDGAKEGRPANLETVRKITENIRIPCELGGGIRSADDAKEAFDAGVARVIIGTAACEKPELVDKLVKKFGAERIVIGIDAKNGKAAVRGWLSDTCFDALELAAKFAEKGIIRFIYTDISTDGMLSGPNLKAVADFCDKVPECKVIASGGISAVSDIKNLISLRKENLEGGIVGKALYEGKVSIKELLNCMN